MSYTAEQLEEALVQVLGADTVQAFRIARISLPEIHKQACLKVFADDIAWPSVKILREALRDLNEHGVYMPLEKRLEGTVPVMDGPEIQRGETVVDPSGRDVEVHSISEEKGVHTSGRTFCVSKLRRREEPSATPSP